MPRLTKKRRNYRGTKHRGTRFTLRGGEISEEDRIRINNMIDDDPIAQMIINGDINTLQNTAIHYKPLHFYNWKKTKKNTEALRSHIGSYYVREIISPTLNETDYPHYLFLFQKRYLNNENDIVHYDDETITKLLNKNSFLGSRGKTWRSVPSRRKLRKTEMKT